MADVRRILVAGVGVLALGAMASCASCKSTSMKEDLALLPKDATVLITINAARMRDTAVWRKLLDLRDATPESKKRYAELSAECGFDPFTQIDGATIALPAPGQGGEFGAIVHGTFNEEKLAACIKTEAAKADADIVPEEYDGKKVYGNRDSGLVGALLDGKTMVLAGHDWSRRILDLATGKGTNKDETSVKDNAAIVELAKKAHASDAIWAVGLVPDSVRAKLEGKDELASAKSLKDAYGSIDFATGLKVDLTLDLGGDADAKDLAGKLNEQLVAAKKSPQVMMLGLAGLLEAVKVTSEGPAFRLVVNYNTSQVEQLIERLTGLLKGGADRAFGIGGAGGGMPSMPMPGGGLGGSGLQLAPPANP